VISKRAGSLNPGVRKREVWAWAMYDFANSGYTTVVITAIYSAYFVAVVAGKAVWASFAWSAALAVSYLGIMLTAPILGAYADMHGAKKRLLALTTFGCVLGTAALAIPGPGDIVMAVIFIVISNFFFGSGENLIAGFLPELARGRAMGRVSGWGWGLGYLGGIVSLGVALAYISHVQKTEGGAADFVPGVLLITASLFALFALPTFLILRERTIQRSLQSTATSSAFARVKSSLAHVRTYQDLARLLLCIVFYQAGIMTVITLAAVYAQQAMHFSTEQTLLMILVVNVTAALGAFVFGYVQDKLGQKLSLTLTLIGWLVMVGLAYTATTAERFWLAANIAGLCLGASQSAGRALVGYLSPLSHRAEFFGLWGFAVKLASIFGPMTYGLVVWVSAGNHRLGMLLTGVYFVIGLFILAALDVKRGRRAALKRQA